MYFNYSLDWITCKLAATVEVKSRFRNKVKARRFVNNIRQRINICFEKLFYLVMQSTTSKFRALWHSSGVVVPLFTLARRYFFLCTQCEKTTFRWFKLGCCCKISNFSSKQSAQYFLSGVIGLSFFYGFPLYSVVYVVVF